MLRARKICSQHLPELIDWAIPFNIRTPPIEVLYISPPWKSKLLTPQEKKIKVPTHSPFRIYSEIKDADTQKTPPPPPRISLNLNRGGADINGMAHLMFSGRHSLSFMAQTPQHYG